MAVSCILLIHNLCCIVCNVVSSYKILLLLLLSSQMFLAIARANFIITWDITCPNHCTPLIVYILYFLLYNPNCLKQLQKKTTFFSLLQYHFKCPLESIQIIATLICLIQLSSHSYYLGTYIFYRCFFASSQFLPITRRVQKLEF